MQERLLQAITESSQIMSHPRLWGIASSLSTIIHHIWVCISNNIFVRVLTFGIIFRTGEEKGSLMFFFLEVYIYGYFIHENAFIIFAKQNIF